MKFFHIQGKLSTVLFFSLIAISLLSCRTNKNITYFKDISDSLYLNPQIVSTAKFEDPKIRPNDILQVSIITLEPIINEMLNTEGTSSFSVQPGTTNTSTSSPSINGFLVDKDGYIELPVVGKIKLTGLTTAEARDFIHKKVEIFYKSPVVNVRFTNFTITVLGEVIRPATYVVPNEKVSILDAIGMAGDLTIYGKRENILLIRDTSGYKQFIRFNLNSSSVITSPYFYLKQGDMVYVEPNKSKIETTDAAKIRNYSLLISLAALVVTIITRL
jgi:polysaccharide export outer membrane protein